MFGDIGHGGVLLGLAIWLTNSAKAKKILPEVYPLRYLFLLMGIFSFYSGWIYNEFFSIPLNVFGSCYGHAAHEEYAPKEDKKRVQAEDILVKLKKILSNQKK